jgi:hypothetical protein
MVDYLMSITTPLDQYHTPTRSPIHSLVAARLSSLDCWQAEMIPTLTVVGPVDISADLAMLFEGLYHRTVQPLRLTQPKRQGEDEDRAQALSQLLEKFHSGVVRDEMPHRTR